jgi:hypothetical protein
MKFTLLLTALFFTLNSYSQNSDSLKKYSYPFSGLFMYKGGVMPAGGTCFFIRKNGRIFIVTAKHVVDGCESKKNGIPYADFLTVFLRDSLGERTDDFISVDIRPFKNRFPCPDTVNTDVIAFEMPKDSNNRKLYSIEHFIKDKFRKTDFFDMYGFPSYSYLTHPDAYVIPKVSHIHVPRKKTEFYLEWAYNDTTKIDSTYIIIANKKLCVDSTLHGYSGSPIFLKELGSNEIRVMGVFSIFGYSKIDKNYKFWKIPVIEEVLRQIDVLLKKD